MAMATRATRPRCCHQRAKVNERTCRRAQEPCELERVMVSRRLAAPLRGKWKGSKAAGGRAARRSARRQRAGGRRMQDVVIFVPSREKAMEDGGGRILRQQGAPGQAVRRPPPVTRPGGS